MMTSLHFWLRLLICCLGLWGCGWLASVVWRRRKENGLITPIITPKMQVKEKLRTAVTNTAKIGLGVVLGTGLGVGIRDRQLVDNRWTYTDVSVLTKFSDREFKVWPDKMKQQRVKICPSSSVDWYEGEILADWTFEQQQDCKRIISYHEKPKGELDAGVSYAR